MMTECILLKRIRIGTRAWDAGTVLQNLRITAGESLQNLNLMDADPRSREL